VALLAAVCNTLLQLLCMCLCLSLHAQSRLLAPAQARLAHTLGPHCDRGHSSYVWSSHQRCMVVYMAPTVPAAIKTHCSAIQATTGLVLPVTSACRCDSARPPSSLKQRSAALTDMFLQVRSALRICSASQQRLQLKHAVRCAPTAPRSSASGSCSVLLQWACC
jgi:hypothetical protein